MGCLIRTMVLVLVVLVLVESGGEIVHTASAFIHSPHGAAYISHLARDMRGFFHWLGHWVYGHTGGR